MILVITYYFPLEWDFSMQSSGKRLCFMILLTHALLIENGSQLFHDAKLPNTPPINLMNYREYA